MRPQDGMTAAARQAVADAGLMRAIASAQIADDQARRIRMRKLAAALAAQQDRLRRKRRAAGDIP